MNLSSTSDMGAPPIQALQLPGLEKSGVNLHVLRLDLMHPAIGGNKWFKLKQNIALLQDGGYRHALSFGGAYSNHLAALAAAGRIYGFDTVGVIRGELIEPLNPVLQFVREQGMALHPVSRSDYRRKNDDEFVRQLRETWGEFYLIPEGGSNGAGVVGTEEIGKICADFRATSTAERLFVGLACGTGTTMAGLLRGMGKSGAIENCMVLGVAVLRAEHWLQDEVARWLSHDEAVPDWRILGNYHCGGYARQNDALTGFLRQTMAISAVPVEPVYTGKLFFGIYQEILQGAVPRGSDVLLIHTGGIHTQINVTNTVGYGA